ncbi:MAG: hypothetical protein WCA81_17410 [Rhizomicrobium sp.]|jgi:hypothetical protein
MSKISRQAGMGALVAAFLVLGASARPDSGAFGSQSAMPLGELRIGALERITAASEPMASAAIRICESSSQSVLRNAGPYAFLAAALQSCSDKALTDALDAFAEIAARLK